MSFGPSKNNEDTDIPRFQMIKQVFKRWRGMPEDELCDFTPEILRELQAVCGGADITTELALRMNAGCQISRVVLDALNRTAEHTARNRKFADAVNRRDGGRCQLTSFRAYTEAAHILDFALCMNDIERYDINNGWCLDVKIHRLWDSGQILAVPDWDRQTIRFEIADWVPDNIRTELILIPELAKPHGIQVPVEMLEYFTRRFELDCARFARIN